ncbi:lanthionine synthetase LanC family protein [Flavobacterium hungaricum]|uniref:Lanthionine synthetase C-like protein n=1 Tax=Flavobacterium hungaricum TaxID=2082725 RepID=A0ABR9TR76_9FLAO|nr:lanthionine synthetase LanC family protein [Flavobacterium hungaricum]MBE8727865.1 hypothetical protein [Flavobacterium hungaricum]
MDATNNTLTQNRMDLIISNIEPHIWKSTASEKRIGALDGLSGIALFYHYLIQIEPREEYQNKLFSIIDQISDLISEEVYNSSLCSGMAGYGWVLSKIKNQNIEIEDEYFEALDDILEEALREETEKNYYDFLHGALGIALYFIERYKDKKEEKTKRILLEFSNTLIDKINHNPESIFLSNSENPNQKCIYFGLAHGLAGTLNFLIFLEKIIHQENQTAAPSIIKIIDFMNLYKIYDEESQQFYPSQVLTNDSSIAKARLGWCQGDLGIANAILNSGIFLNDEKLKKYADVLLKTTTKINVKQSLVNDFALCHGSSGIILQYFIAAKKTNQSFQEITSIWFENLKQQTENYTEFKSFFIDKYINETNILNGSAGLALTLLTLENQISPDWTECLNLY